MQFNSCGRNIKLVPVDVIISCTNTERAMFMYSETVYGKVTKVFREDTVHCKLFNPKDVE